MSVSVLLSRRRISEFLTSSIPFEHCGKDFGGFWRELGWCSILRTFGYSGRSNSSILIRVLHQENKYECVSGGLSKNVHPDLAQLVDPLSCSTARSLLHVKAEGEGFYFLVSQM